MGLFGKLFDKKICDICGEEIGLLGNRKLEDGNCCKACAKKLSPWFTDRKQSTVEEITRQLAYREENKQVLADFQETDSFGNDFRRVLVDRPKGLFTVTPVSGDWREDNPDVLRFDQVSDVSLDVYEDRDELKREVRNADGEIERESYTPRRYLYGYDFRVTIHVKNPYFDEMDLKLNNRQVDVRASFDDPIFGRRTEGSTQPPTENDKRNDPDYAQYLKMFEQIRSLLLDPENRTEAQEPVKAAPEEEAVKPKSKFCRWCGAPVANPTPDGTCEYCGGKLDI